MSAYITLMTPMTDEECLLQALEDVGFTSEQIELHANPTPLIGYQGDRRTQKADIVIRRQHVGTASNDIGFLATPTGYQAFVSGYDSPRYGTSWLSKLGECYQARWFAKEQRLAEEERRRKEEERRQLVEAQREAVYTRAKKMGYRVKETREGKTVRLVLIKRTY